MKNPKTHWLQVDYRAESLRQIITGLDNSINTLQDRVEELGWYDGLWFLEDSEPIYGLAFIAFQNYINGSIKDLYESVNDKTLYYKLGTNSANFEKSDIELIIGLANYIKHKDDEKLHRGTQEILNAFDLKNNGEINNSPIFDGLTILNKDWKLFQILEIVINWRESLIKNDIKHSL